MQVEQRGVYEGDCKAYKADCKLTAHWKINQSLIDHWKINQSLI